MNLSRRQTLTRLGLLGLGGTTLLQNAYAEISGGWEAVQVGGESYITLRSIKDFYGFTDIRISGSKITLRKPKKLTEGTGVLVEFTSGQQDVFMNGIKFVFSFPIKPYKSTHLIHRIDLAKLFDPIMRPHNIAQATGSFDTVIIDPGHGGHDSGAVSRHGNGREKDHALSTGLLLSTELRRIGFKVGLTRQDDRFQTLQQRVDYANKYPNSIFISLHFNSGGGGRASGIETFTLSPKGVAHYGRGLKASDFNEKPGNNNDSANIALATAVHSSVIKATKSRDRGIRRARYSVITGVKHPAILLEGGFLSHSREGALIKSHDYQEDLAIAVRNAVRKYKIATEQQPRRS